MSMDSPPQEFLPCRFTDAWWRRFAVAWNSYASRRVLAGIGTIAIEVSDALQTSTLWWDAEGMLEVLPISHSGIVCFSATYNTWQSYLQSEFTALEGVLSGRILYSGEISATLPFVKAF